MSGFLADTKVSNKIAFIKSWNKQIIASLISHFIFCVLYVDDLSRY